MSEHTEVFSHHVNAISERTWEMLNQAKSIMCVNMEPIWLPNDLHVVSLRQALTKLNNPDIGVIPALARAKVSFINPILSSKEKVEVSPLATSSEILESSWEL